MHQSAALPAQALLLPPLVLLVLVPVLPPLLVLALLVLALLPPRCPLCLPQPGRQQSEPFGAACWQEAPLLVLQKRCCRTHPPPAPLPELLPGVPSLPLLMCWRHQWCGQLLILAALTQQAAALMARFSQQLPLAQCVQQVLPPLPAQLPLYPLSRLQNHGARQTAHCAAWLVAGLLLPLPLLRLPSRGKCCRRW